jgi:CheY-like chemotaxis protein
MRQHTGFIEAHGEPGAGATFRFWLPRSDEAAVRPAAGELGRVAGGPETVLVAEDDPAVREIARRTLERAGYTVIVAENGREAVDRVRDHAGELDLALLDMVMPRMGGPEALELIRDIHPGLPALFASGYAPDEDTPAEAPGGRCGFIAKPYSIHDLLTAVRRMLDDSTDSTT